MNSYINTVTTDPASYTVPSITYNSTTGKLHYEKVSGLRTSKAQAKAGDIVLKGPWGDDVLFVSPEYYSTHYMPRVNGNNMTVVGVVVVPSSHTSDNTVRIVSIKFMDYNNPTTGSTSKVNIYWGNTSADLSLTNYTELKTIVPGTSTTSTSDESYFPTNFHRYLFTENTADRGTHYSSFADADNSYMPSPYIQNEGKSTIYHATGYAASDMNGKSNTDVIINATTVTWDGDTISNSNAAGNYPAACCCRRYAADAVYGLVDSYFGAGHWYLPSIGELGYLCARFEEIDRSRKLVGGESMWGGYYWSSTEFGLGDAWSLYLDKDNYFGYVTLNYRHIDASVLAFCSF